MSSGTMEQVGPITKQKVSGTEEYLQKSSDQILGESGSLTSVVTALFQAPPLGNRNAIDCIALILRAGKTS